MSNGTALSLAEAATAVGMVKSSILRAIKSGRISGTRDDLGQWRIEPAELFRVFEPVAASTDGNGASARPATVDSGALAEAQLRTAGLAVEVGMLREQLADARRDRDAWRDQAQRLALPKPETARKPETAPEPETAPALTWWRRLRTTG
jgi:hypothetical protein